MVLGGLDIANGVSPLASPLPRRQGKKRQYPTLVTNFTQMDALQPRSQKRYADGPMRAYTILVAIGFGSILGCSSTDNQTRAGSSLPTVAIGEIKSGDGTYYDATGDGACS